MRNVEGKANVLHALDEAVHPRRDVGRVAPHDLDVVNVDADCRVARTDQRDRGLLPHAVEGSRPRGLAGLEVHRFVREVEAPAPSHAHAGEDEVDCVLGVDESLGAEFVVKEGVESTTKPYLRSSCAWKAMGAPNQEASSSRRKL